MDVKFGKIKPSSSSFFIQAPPVSEAENFFAKNLNSQKENSCEGQILGSRLNDYDSNILENNAYQDMPDEMLKLEHKIGLLEQTLAQINTEIDALESLGAQIQISDLKERKRKIEEELKELNNKYCQLGVSSKISGHIASVVRFTSNKKFENFDKVKGFVQKNVLAKVSKKFNQNLTMKDALEKLSSINLSVDELVNMQIPYGENLNRYEKLTAYLNKANVIHSKISHDMKDSTKKVQ